MSALQTSSPINRVLAALGGGRRSGENWSARCPAHQDRNASLSVSLGRDSETVVLHCHAGCATPDVVRCAGLEMADLFPPKVRPARRREVAAYLYTDEAGNVLFEVVRFDPKDFRQRRPDGSGGYSWSLNGCRRVLYRLPELVEGVKAGSPVFVVEGEKDADALARAGYVATCGPGGAGKWSKVAGLACKVLAGAEVTVVADKDEPGRKHAAEVAVSLAGVAARVVVVEAKTGKDAADHLGAGHGVDDFLLVEPAAVATPDPPEPTQREDGSGDSERVKVSVATTLVNLALDRYRLVASADGEPFAVAIDGPLLARPLRGSRGVRAELASAYFEATGKAASASALVDALAVLEGRALAQDREDAALRVAQHDDGIVIDLGNSQGDAVSIKPGSWTVRDGSAGGSPVLFRRSALTGTLPRPTGRHDLHQLERLRDLLNVNPRDWPVLVGWLVASLLPSIPHPILLSTGEQGTGKSSLADLLVGLIDPSPAQLRSCPRDLDQWAVAAAGSWVVALDNVSTLAPWLSDALCRAVTGDGTVKRALYTDGDLAVLAFRRVIVLTSISTGSLNGDLAERIVPVELERIDPTRRRSDADVRAAYAEARPYVLGGLYDLVSRVLSVLPDVHLETMPRMADFARVLAAVDQVTGWSGLAAYLSTTRTLAASVIEDDPVAIALVALLARSGDYWKGTATDLLDALELPERMKDAPRSPQAITGRITRITPGLRAAGITVDRHHSKRLRTLTITRTEEGREPTSPTSPDPSDLHERGDEGVTRPGPQLDLVTPHDEDHVTTLPPTSPQTGPLTCTDAQGDEGDEVSQPPSHVHHVHQPR